MIRESLWRTILTPTYGFIALGWGVLFFDVSYYVMKYTVGAPPGVLMCVPGGALTPLNVGFSIVMGVLSGVLIAGLGKLMTQKVDKARSISSGAVSGFGGLLGLATVFCPLCTFGVLTLWGTSLSLEFFVLYNVWIKVLSLAIMGLSLWWIDAQIRENCAVCAVVGKKK